MPNEHLGNTQGDTFAQNADRSIAKIINGILNSSQFMDAIAEERAEKEYEKTFKEVVTLEECLDFCQKGKSRYPKVGGFIASIQKNANPRNENDQFIVIIGLLDANSKPFTNDGTNAISRVIHTKTIDDKMIKFLGGDDKKICMFK